MGAMMAAKTRRIRDRAAMPICRTAAVIGCASSIRGSITTVAGLVVLAIRDFGNRSSGRHFDQPEMTCHRSEIIVVMEQGQPIFDAPGPYQHIDRLSNCDAPPPQRTKITGSPDRNGLAGHGHDVEPTQEGFDPPGRPLAIEALQHFAEHQVTHNYFSLTERGL
jgi:hypothetical protein